MQAAAQPHPHEHAHAQEHEEQHNADEAADPAPGPVPAPAQAHVVVVELAAVVIAEGNADDAGAAAAAAPNAAAAAQLVVDPAQPAGADDPPQCKICFETESTAATGPLYRPCRCRGSSQVHTRCLQQWRQQAPDPSRCESCRYVYRTSRRGWHRFVGSTGGALLCSAVLVSGGFYLLHSLLPRRSVRFVPDGAVLPPVVPHSARFVPWKLWRDNLFGTPTPVIVVVRSDPPPLLQLQPIAARFLPHPLLDSLSRITSVVGVLFGRVNPIFGGRDLTRALLTHAPANSLQREDMMFESLLTMSLVLGTSFVVWKKRVGQWLATTPEIVLPFEE